MSEKAICKYCGEPIRFIEKYVSEAGWYHIGGDRRCPRFAEPVAAPGREGEK
jgi:hypothetical protein